MMIPPPYNPGHERQTYRAAVRDFRTAFDAAFFFPLEARRAFRLAVRTLGRKKACAVLRLEPFRFGAPHRHRMGEAAGPAAAYLIHHARRPRAMLKGAAMGLRRVVARREAVETLGQLKHSAATLGDLADAIAQERARALQAAVRAHTLAGLIFAKPGPAFRRLHRFHRRHGPAEARRVLTDAPEAFGAVLSAHRLRTYLPSFIQACERAALACRRTRAGMAQRTAEAAARAEATRDALEATVRLSGDSYMSAVRFVQGARSGTRATACGTTRRGFASRASFSAWCPRASCRWSVRS
jgi:hypothetical protein